MSVYLLINLLPKCPQAKWCQVLWSIWGLEVGGHAAVGSLLAGHSYSRVSSTSDVLRLALHRQTSSAVPLSDQAKSTYRKMYERKLTYLIRANRICSMKRGRQTWRQCASLEQAHLKCPPMNGKKRRGRRWSVKSKNNKSNYGNGSVQF